jgi:hypothetical protein
MMTDLSKLMFGFLLVRLGSLLPGGRIFDQITQKRALKIVHCRKNLEAIKLQRFAKSGRKEAQKYFYYNLE